MSRRLFVQILIFRRVWWQNLRHFPCPLRQRYHGHNTQLFSLPNLHIQRLQRCRFKLSLLSLMLKLQDISSFIWRMCARSSKTHHRKYYQKRWGGEIMVHYDSLHSYLQPHRCLNKNAIYVQCIILTSGCTLLSCNKRENTSRDFSCN